MNSITDHIANLRVSGEQSRDESRAAIFEYFFPSLQRMATGRLRNAAIGTRDSGGAAGQAINGALAELSQNQLQKVQNSDDLRAFLLNRLRDRITDQLRRHDAQKRGSDRLVAVEALPAGSEPASVDPTVDDLLVLKARLEEATEALSPLARKAALLSFAGLDDKEVAAQVGRSLSTIGNYKPAIKGALLNALRRDGVHPSGDAAEADAFHLAEAAAAVTHTQTSGILAQGLESFLATLAPKRRSEIEAVAVNAQELCRCCRSTGATIGQSLN